MNVETLYRHFLSSPESTWTMKYPNAVDLYNFIMEHPVKKVLGFGTGVGLSDSVIALAWRDKGEKDGKIISLEQFDKCIKLAEELIPEELKKYIEIKKSDVSIWTSDKLPYTYYSIYKEVPEGDWDVIVNDGPSPFLDKDGNFLDLPNGTIHKMTMENKIKPNCFVVYDGRIASLKNLERFFSDNFYLYHVPQRGSNFTILQRKNNPLSLKDSKYISMKQQTNYFKGLEEK